MTKILTQDQIDRFWRDGCVFPIRVMSEDEAAAIRRRLEAHEAQDGKPLRADLREKSHLLFTCLADLVRHDRVLDAVEDLYGPNLLCWATNFFIKEPKDPAFVSWHQDSTYWGLDQPDVVSAWIALTPSNASNGAMGFIPGSHTVDQMPHRDTFGKHNLLSRGQEVAVEVDESKGVRIDLQPGEMSLHHVRLVHGSPPNPSRQRRIGFVVRYLPTHVAQTGGEDSATLVRGIDEHHHFELEPRPRIDMDPEFVAFRKHIVERNSKIFYSGTTLKGDAGRADRGEAKTY